jgi:hypothetical protein
MPGTCDGALREGISKAFFFEKKKQKTFDSWYAPRRQRAQRDKSFLVLFFKKEPLSFYITLNRPESLAMVHARRELAWLTQPRYEFRIRQWIRASVSMRAGGNYARGWVFP